MATGNRGKTGMSKADKLAALRDKLNKTDVGGSTKGWFKPKKGLNTLRILPEVDEMEWFFQEVGRHYLPNKKSFYCPKFTSDGDHECPACDLVNELYTMGDEDSKKMAGDIRVSKQYWMNVIDRNAEEKGVQIYTPGVMVFASIMSMINDPDYGDITDPEDGFDLKITKEGEGRETRYSVLARPKQTALSNDDDEFDEWIDAANDMTYVMLSDDSEEDDDLRGDATVYILPYDRLVEEFGLDIDSLYDMDDGDEEEEEEKEQHPVKRAISERRSRRNRRR